MVDDDGAVGLPSVCLSMVISQTHKCKSRQTFPPPVWSDPVPCTLFQTQYCVRCAAAYPLITIASPVPKFLSHVPPGTVRFAIACVANIRLIIQSVRVILSPVHGPTYDRPILDSLHQYGSPHDVGNINKLCGRPPQYTPAPASWPLTFCPWKWCPSHMWRGLPLCQC